MKTKKHIPIVIILIALVGTLGASWALFRSMLEIDGVPMLTREEYQNLDMYQKHFLYEELGVREFDARDTPQIAKYIKDKDLDLSVEYQYYGNNLNYYMIYATFEWSKETNLKADRFLLLLNPEEWHVFSPECTLYSGTKKVYEYSRAGSVTFSGVGFPFGRKKAERGTVSIVARPINEDSKREILMSYIQPVYKTPIHLIIKAEDVVQVNTKWEKYLF